MTGAVDERRRRRAAAAVEHRPGGRLGALDVGLVERVDPDQPAGDGGGVLPQQHLGAERGVDRHAVRRRPAGPCRTRSRARPCASTSSGVLGSKFGASRPSTTTGRMPLPSLPVDSATSCSAQSPKPGYGAPASAMHQLVDAGQVGDAEQGPEPQPGVVDRVGLEGRADRLGLVEQPGDVGAGQPARHQPERGERGVPAADRRVGEEDAVARAAGRLLQRRARVGDDDDPLGGVDAGVA